MHSFGNWVVIKLTIHEKLQRCWCMSALWHFYLTCWFTELEKVLNVPSILKLATEMFLKSAVIFKSGTDVSV